MIMKKIKSKQKKKIKESRILNDKLINENKKKLKN